MLRISYLSTLLCLLFFKLHVHTQEEIIVKFNYSYLDYEFIDNENKKVAPFHEIFKDKAKRQLHILNSKFPGLLESRVSKIFDFLSTEDSVSISRQGYEVTIPPFWAVFNLKVPDDYKSEQIIQFLDKFQPLVEYAHRNFEVIPLNVPNDELYFRQESLFDPAGLADINVEQAWETETGKKFVKVGVHDNGVDSLHPDLDVLTGGDYYQNDTAPDWGLENSGVPHGTQVAGIIGAKRNNKTGIAGIAGGDGSDTTGCSIIDFKYPFLSSSSASYILAGVVDAARSAGSYFDYGDNYHFGGGNDYYFDNTKGFGIHIGNSSYTIRSKLPLANQTKDESGDESSVITTGECGLCREAYLFSLQNGVINVVARGNSGFDNGDPTYVEGASPQNLSDGWIISVGASGYDGNTVEENVNQSISEQSTGFYSLYGGNMDLVAPGSDSIVYSTLTTNVSGLYSKFNGSSAAAPHVSGVAALLLSHYNRPCYSNQNLTVEDVEYLLEKSATDLFDPGFDIKSGAGRLNAGAALEMIKDPTKQIIHPDSLISSKIVKRDIIALAYNRAFVADGWGPISQNIPLEQSREYKVERVFVENTYSFDEYFTGSTTLLDSWACPSISNSVEFYRDTITTQLPVGNTGTTDEGHIFQLFDRDPFDSIVDVNTINRTIVVGGYFYKFLLQYSQIELNYVGTTGETLEEVIEDPISSVNAWYPFNPENNVPRMVASLYISDSTLTEQYIFPCDSTNILVDDTTITDPASTNEYALNDFTAKIFPNPGSEAFTITFSDSGVVNQIIAYSSEGKKITQIPTKEHTLHVNVSSWAKGVYYIKVNGESFSTTLKYLKQ